MAEPPAGYREILSTALDVLALLAVAVGVGFALLPALGWATVGVAGTVLYAALHVDALSAFVRRQTGRVVAEVRKRRAAARAAREVAASKAAKAAAAELKRQAAAAKAAALADTIDLAPLRVVDSDRAVAS
jgi:hypothetical protein